MCGPMRHRRTVMSHDGSSTIGILAGIAPAGILTGDEIQVALVHWRSSKTPRQCLGSNGAEVQAITEGEDLCFRVRALWAEIHGMIPNRYKLYDQVRDLTKGEIVMDSRGIYDSMTRNTSSLHGLRSGRSGYELTLSVGQALRIHTSMRWVNGNAQLADSLTKSCSRRVIHQFLASGQFWKLVHDERFISGRKVRKKELLEKLAQTQNACVEQVEQMARENNWPMDYLSLRSMGDAITEQSHDHDHLHENIPPWFTDET